MATAYQTRDEIGLHIDIFECETCGYDPDKWGFLRPGNSLEGLIHISTKDRLQFKSLKVMFQGLESTRDFTSQLNGNNINLYPVVYRDLVPIEARKLFLNVEYQAPLETIQKSDGPNALKLYTFRFFFIVPSAGPRPDDGIQPLFQTLPPYFETNNSYLAPILSVTYLVHAIICCVSEGREVLRWLPLLKSLGR
ncbi:hypothetical protein BDW59DRAFT_156603 [Aspergillus cavernicola]|uniref:Uncharacterized protein n=1 Tax=Aspergillus cavernicola TaxID=176166 RepID=A0ABR4J425_9EURO